MLETFDTIAESVKKKPVQKIGNSHQDYTIVAFQFDFYIEQYVAHKFIIEKLEFTSGFHIHM